jgi:pSer/pThr/pTyr-binding forkhead associated (FHA) protein
VHLVAVKKQMFVASLPDWAKKFQDIDETEFRAATAGPFLLLDTDCEKAPIADIGQIFAGNPLILGRGDTCDIPVNNGGVSRQHCGLHFDGRSWTLTDYKSTNGSFASERLAPMRAQPLLIGELFRLGDDAFLKLIDHMTMFELMETVNSDSKTFQRTSVIRTKLPKMAPRSTRRFKNLSILKKEKAALMAGKKSVPQARRRSIPKGMLEKQKDHPRLLERLVEEVRSMESEDFLRFFPYPFLVLLNAKWGLQADTDLETLQLSNLSGNTKLGKVAFWILATPIEGDPINIGRSEENDIVIRQPSVSRFHGQLNEYEDGMWLRDTSSTNGIFVAGERLHGEVPLNEEALVRFGGDCSLQYMTPNKMWDFTRLFVEFPHLGL